MSRKTKKTKYQKKQLPPKTKQQTKIINNIFKFRFLDTHQIQKILKHKNPTRIQTWLKDLKINKYIATDDDEKENKTPLENSQPFIYYLGLNGRRYSKDKGIDLAVLDKVYKEKTMLPPFREHCMTIANIFLWFRDHKKENEELKFYTQNNLHGFDYLPDEPDPIDAYIVLKSPTYTRRFLLKVFDEGDPTWLYEQTFRKLIEYAEDQKWEQRTKTKLPQIFIVCPNSDKKYFVYKYGGALLRKAITIDMSVFVSAKDQIRWQKVEENSQKF